MKEIIVKQSVQLQKKEERKHKMRNQLKETMKVIKLE
jgi:hypothetical protein